MALRIYNTMSRQKEPFKPLVPGKVGIYVCGPTVYKPAHIGHLVGPVIFDTVKRYLEYNGYEVTLVNNITDIDDKIIHRAQEEGTTVEQLAEAMTDDYYDNLATMGVGSIDAFPRATDNIEAMQEMIAQLVERDYAYVLDGDVYFDVTKDKNYGCLSHRSIEEMLAGSNVEGSERKRNPADFALWKGSKPGEPAWESPWGPGRPGWHIECSAMSMKILGDSFDIHGGGLDLLFPHHENELAQSECFTGKPFVKYWMHNGLMQSPEAARKVGARQERGDDLTAVQEEQEAHKLAGSKGAESVKELFKVFPPETVRFFLLSTHYRSPLELSDERIGEVDKSLDGFYRLFETFQRLTGEDFYAIDAPQRREETTPLENGSEAFFAELDHLRQRFLEAMDDDFNTGGATGALFELRRVINGFITERQLTAGEADPQDVQAVKTAMTLLKELAGIMGVFQQPVEKAPAFGTDEAFVGQLIELLLEIRTEARQAKNFATADKIRDRLKEMNVAVEDRPDGTVWRWE